MTSALLRACVSSVVLQLAASLRRKSRQRGIDVESVACPVLAALVLNKHAKEDKYGRVSQNMTTYALMQTGNSDMMALFQSKGIAGFNDTDLHQNVRIKFSKDTDRWLNFRQMNAQDNCVRGGPPNLPAGVPCNANIEFQQHGYSTLLRDPDGGSNGQKRFDAWFELPGVLSRTIGDGHLGRVMTLDGLGKLLKYARETGDVSGEFALKRGGKFKGSPLQEFHPSITNPSNQSAVSTWQAVTAWSSFWAAFARESGKHVYMTYDDLWEFFVKGDFPKGWVMKQWGFRETFATVCALKGSGAGDQWSSIICDVLDKYGRDADEKTYFYQMINAIGSIGAREDDIGNSYP